MERIKKAIEEARIARTAGGSVRPTILDASFRTSPAPWDVHYEETRSFPVTDDVLDAHRVLSIRADTEVISAYNMLRTQLLQVMSSNGWTTLAVTSTGRGDGKTLTAVNLAISIAREVNFTVLLADLDFHGGGIHECFAHEPEVDLLAHLNEDAPLGEALFNPGIPRLVVLPSVGPAENSSELLTSPKMRALVTELKNRYSSRLVVFDLPPLLAADDAIAFVPFVDAVLLVVQDGATREEELRRSLEPLDGANVVGTVLNRCSERA